MEGNWVGKLGVSQHFPDLLAAVASGEHRLFHKSDLDYHQYLSRRRTTVAQVA